MALNFIHKGKIVAPLPRDGEIVTDPVPFSYDGLDKAVTRTVKAATKAILTGLQDIKNKQVEIGKRLVAVREALPAGQFDGWLQTEFGMSRRSAYNYIDQAKLVGQDARFAQLDPTARIALAAPSTPDAVRETVLAEIDAGNKPRVKDIKERISSATEKRLATIQAKNDAHQRETVAKHNEEEKVRQQAASEAIAMLEEALGDKLAAFAALIEKIGLGHHFAYQLKKAVPHA